MAYIIAEPCIDVKDKSCVEACPVDAIYSEDELPEKWSHFIDINRDFFEVRKT